MTTDERLLQMFGDAEGTENNKRILALIDDLGKAVFPMSDYATLVAALADTTKKISYLTADTTLTGMLAFSRAFRFYGQDFSLTDATLDENQYMAAQISHEDVIIQDVEFHISGATTSPQNTIYAIDVGAANSRIEGCTFVMANSGDAGSVSVYYEGYAGHILKDNTMSNGVAVTGGAVLDEVSGNTFAATKGFGLGECTIGGLHYFEADPIKLAAIKAYLIAEGNVTTGEATGLVVEGYFEA